MEYKKIHLIIIPVLLMVLSCGSRPKAETTQELTNGNGTAVTEESFDPLNITQEYYTSTMEDVRSFIEELNRIIRNRNYNAWRATLSPEYFEEISSSENLQQISEQPAMTTRRIVLKNAEDFFMHVVVPSRANSRVDDIEFISLSRVKAFTINTNRAGEEQRLLLYNLEKTGNLWKIIN